MLQPVKQGLPGGDGGQGHGGCLREIERGRLAADNAFVNQVQFGIGAAAGTRAGVPDLVARA